MQWYLVGIFVLALLAVLLIFHALGFFKMEKNEQTPKAKAEYKQNTVITNKNNVSATGILIAAVMVIFFIYREANNYERKSNQSNDFTAIEALSQCQWTLKKLSRDPDTAEVPYVENFGSKGEYYFAWGAETKYARMRNGLGLEVPISASCIVNAVTKKITQLTFDGKTIIQMQSGISAAEDASKALLANLEATYQRDVERVNQREQQQKLDLIRSVTNEQKRGLLETDIVIQAGQDRIRLATNYANEQIRIADETYAREIKKAR